MKNRMQIGVVGLGCRGSCILEDALLPMEGFSVVAVCDVYEDRRRAAAEAAVRGGAAEPTQYDDYRALLAHPGLDAVYIATSWQTHTEIALAAMRAGVAAASDVGGAFCLEECWELVRVHEQTGVPCMFMENCCYGRTELMVLNMLRRGVFGEIVHCAGGYYHDLRGEVAFGRQNRHYRLDNYLSRNTENYPTHELGPIAQLLGINRGNRMVTLSAAASRAAGMSAFIKGKAVEGELAGRAFAQGDVVTTVIRCAGGETITLTLDTTLPRPYSRGFTVHGTKALYTEDNNSIFIDGEHNKFDFSWKEQWNNFDQYREAYEHPIWRAFLAQGVQGGHDGMDWLVFQAFLNAWRADAPMPIDVYDMASWMAVSALAEDSIAQGGHPVAVPDFTGGRWMTRRPD